MSGKIAKRSLGESENTENEKVKETLVNQNEPINDSIINEELIESDTTQQNEEILQEEQTEENKPTFKEIADEVMRIKSEFFDSFMEELKEGHRLFLIQDDKDLFFDIPRFIAGDSTTTSEENSNKKEIENIQSIIKSLNNELKKVNNTKTPKLKTKTFAGFPKYQDWWIRELWSSHQAYFALFKWKDIINNLCK